MSCSKCGQKLNDGDLFCSKCGNRVASAPDTPVTPNTPPPAADSAAAPMVQVERTAQTGADMTPSPPEKSPDGKSRLAYQVLAWSFGWLGLHNFYARRIAPACAQILLTAVAVVLSLTQGGPSPWFLPVAAWCIIEIFAVRKDGKGNQWGENFASAPGIESINAMVLAQFRTNSRRCIVAFFLLLILGVYAYAIVASFAVGLVVVGVAFLCLTLMSCYYHARSKGYTAGYSIVLALLGFPGIVMFMVGASFLALLGFQGIVMFIVGGFVVMHPFSLLIRGNIFLSGILLPIAAFKVARRILLKNGFKALSPTKKALTAAAIVGSFALASFVLIGVVGFAVIAREADEVAGLFNRSDEAEKQFNRGVALMKTGEYEDAVKAFRIAAEIGMPEAQYNLGYCYSNGKGVEKDMVEAVKWIRKAAEQGLAEAQFSLGCAYAYGNGVDKDKAEAARWFRKAAKEGDAGAQLILGKCYATGEGVEKDMVEAVKWIRKAAEQGHVEAQWAMAGCYAGGEGVEEDMVEAVKWIRKAARQGHPIAKKALKELGESEE